MPMPRVFVALPLPPDVARGLSGLLPDLPGLRRVAPELMHVTLAFLGRIDEERVAEVTEAVRTAAAPVGSFAVELDALGRFPTHGRPSTIWAGASTRAMDRIVRLGAAVRAELLRRQVPFDVKPLRAHVTLARVRESASDAEAGAIAAAVKGASAGVLAFQVEEVDVVESRLSPKGPLYSSRGRIPLTGPSR